LNLVARRDMRGNGRCSANAQTSQLSFAHFACNLNPSRYFPSDHRRIGKSVRIRRGRAAVMDLCSCESKRKPLPADKSVGRLIRIVQSQKTGLWFKRSAQCAPARFRCVLANGTAGATADRAARR